MKPVLLIAAKNPLPGNVKTRLTPNLSHKQASELYACFLQDLVERVFSLTEFDTYISFSENSDTDLEDLKKLLPYPNLKYQVQEGKDLGEKLKNSFKHFFNLGYKRIVIIGSDHPDLPLNILHKAFENLQKSNAVIGPANDGGYYLIGLSKPETEVFENIDWSTAVVFSQTIEKFADLKLSHDVLKVWSDVDDYEALIKFWEKLPKGICPRTEDFLENLFKNVPKT